MVDKFIRTAVIGIVCAVPWVNSAWAESLNTAVFNSILNSQSRNAAISNIQAQSKLITIAQGAKRAQVSLFGEAALERIDNPTSLSVTDNGDTNFATSLGVDVTFNILDGLRTANRIYSEATLLDAEIIRLGDATETLALNAVQAYIDVLRHRQIVGATQQNISVHQRIVRQVGQQVNAGKLSDADRFRANDKLLAARLTLAEAQAQLADAISHYELVIGTRPKGKMSVAANLPVPKSKAAMEQSAVANSLQIKLADNTIQAQGYTTAIDEADWKPRLDAFVGANVGNDRGGSSGRDSEVSAGLRLNWTLYKGGTRKATIARNHDLEMRAHYRKKQVENEVRDFARRVWNAYRSAQERRALLDRSVSANVRIVRAFRNEFEAAKRPLLQVLDAERTLFNLKVRRINASAAVAYQGYRVLAAQNKLSDHFGLARAGRALTADFEQRVRASPKGEFDISAPPLE